MTNAQKFALPNDDEQMNTLKQHWLTYFKINHNAINIVKTIYLKQKMLTYTYSFSEYLLALFSACVGVGVGVNTRLVVMILVNFIRIFFI